jgi:hypothetical protein
MRIYECRLCMSQLVVTVQRNDDVGRYKKLENYYYTPLPEEEITGAHCPTCGIVHAVDTNEPL